MHFELELIHQVEDSNHVYRLNLSPETSIIYDLHLLKNKKQSFSQSNILLLVRKVQHAIIDYYILFKNILFHIKKNSLQCLYIKHNLKIQFVLYRLMIDVKIKQTICLNSIRNNRYFKQVFGFNLSMQQYNIIYYFSLPKKTMEIFMEPYAKLSGDILTRRYKSLEFLGAGQYGNVQKVERLNDNKIFALKLISNDENFRPNNAAKLRRQIQIQKKVDHPSICKLYSAFQHQQKMCLVLQHCPGTPLDKLLKQGFIFQQQNCKKILWELVSAVEYMHANGIIHRDLKPSNIIIDSSNRIKIIDFGLATRLQFQGDKKRSLCGTPAFIAPQIAKLLKDKKPNNKGYAYEVDIWAIGIILHLLITGQLPFKVANRKQCIDTISEGKITVSTNICDEAADLIKKILIQKPQDRISLQDIKNHPFLSTQRVENNKKSQKKQFNLVQWKSLKNLYTNKKYQQKNHHQFESAKYKSNQPLKKSGFLSAAQLKLKQMLGKLSSKQNIYNQQKVDTIETQTSIQIQKDLVYINWIKNDNVWVYTLSNGYQGTYQNKAQINILYNNQDYLYFAIRRKSYQVININGNMTLKDQITPHFKAIACNVSQNTKKCESYENSRLVYLQKIFEIKAQFSYLLMLSNQTYQLLNHKTQQTIIYDPKQSNIAYINLKDQLTTKKISIDIAFEDPAIKKMFTTLQAILKKLNKNSQI